MFKIPVMSFRGGTSKGPCFLKSDLPIDAAARDALLLKLMGSPSERQIDGIGGGDTLSSKVVIVGPSKKKNVDVDYLFCQVVVDKPIVDTSVSCGNMLSVVAPFAIEKGLVKATHPETTVTIYNENLGIVMKSTVQTPNGQISYEGDTHIDGVSGGGSPIKLTYLNAGGSKTGKILPTGKPIDIIDGIAVSCVDLACPMVILQAESLGKKGYESKTELDNDKPFLANLESIRRKASLLMGLGDASKSIIPKICYVSPPKNGGTITSRYFTPLDCHDAHAVTGGLCLSAACLIEGTIANKVSNLKLPDDLKFEKEIEIEHPSGKITLSILAEWTSSGLTFPEASSIRTARPLYEGYVFVPGLRPQLESKESKESDKSKQEPSDRLGPKKTF